MTGPSPRTGLWAVVLAAGSGQRFGGGPPKQVLDLGGRRVMDWSIETLAAWCPQRLVVVLRSDRLGEPDPFLDRAGARVVAGGETRSASVRAGLSAVDPAATLVLVHDAARPFVPHRVVADLLAAIDDGADAVVPGIAVADTIKRVSGGRVVETVPREELVAVQTPQLFRADVLRDVHRDGGEATDDANLVELSGGDVRVVDGAADLRKVTTAEDLEWLRGRLRSWT